jgi:hypothetical protein
MSVKKFVYLILKEINLNLKTNKIMKPQNKQNNEREKNIEINIDMDFWN